MKKLAAVFVMLSVFAISFVKGQPAPARFGKVDPADLEMKVYDLDTTAEAVILCDYGEFNTNTFQFTRLKRIKVLKKEGLDQVNGVYNISGSGLIKGMTYNLVDGEIVESKLKNESIFKEQILGDNYRYRVTMPDVRVGSIVDIQYSFPLLPNEWRFQDRIPVRWSELRIPESPYVTFQKSFFGFLPLYVNESGRWVGRNMPALHDEPYMNSLTNYLNKVEIELSNITLPNYSKFYTSSWDAVNDYLLHHSRFGEKMSMALFLTEDVKTIEAMNLAELDKMKAACNLVKQKIKWNEEESLYAYTDLNLVYKKGSGNSAEINLTLVMLLKKLGFNAFPVALSTRENGLISPVFPTIDKLNYVIAGVKHGEKNYLFDATEPYLNPELLPFRVLNGRGRIINDKLSGWIEIKPESAQRETVLCNMKLEETGEMAGTISYTDSDYEAFYFRKNFKSYNSQDEYIQDIESSFPGVTINSSSFKNIDSVASPVTEKYEVSLTGYASNLGEMISINPLLIEKKESNPFKMENRKYPIDYGHPIKNRYIITISLPDGYEVSELPKSCNLVLPDKAASFVYLAKQNGNTIQLTAIFEINKTLFLENEYQLLKEFYNQVISKHAEVIILKKVT
ncbi:MAG: DUF3857 domain-containing protein [Bacteroidales bacterium]|nr:DUF3857 domain-containing protein [Bacteroidales bacterium]